MSTTPSPTEFVLAPSGPCDLLTEKVWHSRHEHMRWGRRALVVALFCWVPLLVASILRPNPDADISFLKDLAAHARFLLIVPVLIFAEGPIGTRSRLVTRQFLASGLIGDDSVAEYEGVVRCGRRMVNSWLAEFLILALSATLVWMAVHGLLLESSSFWFERTTVHGTDLAPAGWWYWAVATPISIFLMLRWLWRYIVWCWFLARVSRMHLNLSGAHPDRVGGLGFITFHQSVFALITFAVGCAVSAAFANRILYDDTVTLLSYKWLIVGIALFSVLFGLLPLLVFTPPLARTKRAAWGKYTQFASEYVARFEKKWMRDDESEEMLGSGDIQSMADLGGTFERMLTMRVFAIDRRIALSFALAIVGPLLPLLLTMMPLKDIVKMLFHALI